MLMTVACTVAAICILFAAVTVFAACKLAGEADREMERLHAERDGGDTEPHRNQ